jgi:predicted dehydrogenase
MEPSLSRQSKPTVLPSPPPLDPTHVTPSNLANVRYESVKGDYNALYANLYEAIKGGKDKLIVKPEQAIDVLRIIELGQKAAKEERIVSARE